MVKSSSTMVPIDYEILQAAISLVRMRHGSDLAVVDHFLTNECEKSSGKCGSPICSSNMDAIKITNSFGYFHKTNKPARTGLLQRLADLILSEIPKTVTKELGIQTETEPTTTKKKSFGKNSNNTIESRISDKLFTVRIAIEAEKQDLIRKQIIKPTPIWKTEIIKPNVVQTETSVIKPNSVIFDNTKKQSKFVENIKKDSIRKSSHEAAEVIDLVAHSEDSETCQTECPTKQEVVDIDIAEEVLNLNAEDSKENAYDTKLDNDVTLDATFNEETNSIEEETTDLVPIGFGRVKIERSILNKIANKDYKQATRKLLTEVFTRETLATSSLTGKPSPAFPGRAAKVRLSADLVDDIVKYVLDKYDGTNERLIKTCITHKCADESKISRNRNKNPVKKGPLKNKTPA